MHLDNPFSDATRRIFFDGFVAPECYKCHTNGQHRGGLQLHHIWGRCSSSPFNASILCQYCHNSIGQNQKTRQWLFMVTFRLLKNAGYSMTPRDDLFLISVENDLRQIARML